MVLVTPCVFAAGSGLVLQVHERCCEKCRAGTKYCPTLLMRRQKGWARFAQRKEGKASQTTFYSGWHFSLQIMNCLK